MKVKSQLINKNVILIFSITLFAVMGVASISPAFPEIRKEFGLTAKEVKWLVSIFTIPGVLLSPFMGILADKFGRKIIIIPSLFIFGIGGYLCSTTDTYSLLLKFRFLQGVGAAALGSLNITLIGDLFQGHQRTKIMSINASVLSIGTASYPAIGGLLAGIHWQYVFYLPVLSLPVALLVTLFLDNIKPLNNHSFNTYLINLWRTINKKQVWGLFMINMLVFIILYGVFITFIPELLAQRFHASTEQIGISQSAMSFTTAIAAILLSMVAKRISSKKILTFSSVAYFIALVLLTFSNTWLLVILSLVIYGAGQGFCVPSLQTMLVGHASTNERAAFMSINGLMLRLAQFAGPIIISSFYINNSISYTFIAGAGIALFMLLIVQVFIPK